MESYQKVKNFNTPRNIWMQGCQKVLHSYWSHWTLVLYNAFYIFKLSQQVSYITKRKHITNPLLFHYS